MALCSRHSTPVLVKRLKEMNFDTRKFTNGTLFATKRMLKDYRDDNPDPVPLLYQTGYLTIADVDDEKGAYILSFPNEEVKYGFLESLLPMYVGNVGAGSGKDFRRYRNTSNQENWTVFAACSKHCLPEFPVRQMRLRLNTIFSQS